MTMLFPASFISMEGAGRDSAHLSDSESTSSGGGKTKQLFGVLAVGNQCRNDSWSIVSWWFKGSSSTLMARLLWKALKFSVACSFCSMPSL